MSSPPPPAGFPRQSPPPPRRRVRTGMLVTAIMLLVLSPIIFCAGFLWALLPLMDSDATVLADGTPTRVDVPADSTRAFYVDRSSRDTSFSCEVVGSAGEPVKLRRVTGDVEVDGYRAIREFDTGDGDLTVTCTPGDGMTGGLAESEEVRVGPVPGAGFVVAIVVSFALPAVVFLIGLVLLIVALVKRRPA